MTTTQNLVFQLAGVAYVLAFCLLLLSLVASYRWETREVGRLGIVAVTVAIVGPMAALGAYGIPLGLAMCPLGVWPVTDAVRVGQNWMLKTRSSQPPGAPTTA